MKTFFYPLIMFVLPFLVACTPTKPNSEANSSSITPEPVALIVSTPEPVSYSPASTATPLMAAVEPPSMAATESAETAVPIVTTAPATPPAAPIPTPHPAKGATEAAMRAYPDLAKKDSMFNRAFRDLFDEKKKTDPAFLAKPDWPLVLGKETAAMLSVANPVPVETPGKVASNNNPSQSSWLQERLKQPTALEKGAYNQHQAVYSRRYYYYTDSSGSFWIDRYGTRHYY